MPGLDPGTHADAPPDAKWRRAGNRPGHYKHRCRRQMLPGTALRTPTYPSVILQWTFREATMNLRHSFRAPIPEIEEAARCLDDAVAAHLRGERGLASALLQRADDKSVRDWTDSVWGKKSPYTQYRPVQGAPGILPENQRAKPQRPTAETRQLVHRRDGFYCRFCKIPVIRAEVRTKLSKLYPETVQWGGRNLLQHAALQCMWAQYDHILPHSRGGNNEIDNIYLTCAACNYGRMHYTLEEVGLIHPGLHEPRQGSWDGLERLQ